MSEFDPEWDYAYETRAPLDERIARLAERAREARAEAAYALHQPGLAGPARNAQEEAERLETEIAELREVAVRVDRGYPYWDRHGFELAVDACGEAWGWQPLSESVTRDFVYGHDDVDVRLPLDVQRAYSTAVESDFFSRFEICSTFETDGYGEEVLSTRHYLFGVQDFPHLGACLFFIDQWGG